MLTSTLRVLAAALALMSAAPATELPHHADAQRPNPALRARHRPPHELTDVCRVEPVVTAPVAVAVAATAKAAASSCTDSPPASSEAGQ
jgi:hypothetical protein